MITVFTTKPREITSSTYLCTSWDCRCNCSMENWVFCLGQDNRELVKLLTCIKTNENCILICTSPVIFFYVICTFITSQSSCSCVLKKHVWNNTHIARSQQKTIGSNLYKCPIKFRGINKWSKALASLLPSALNRDVKASVF